MFFASLFQKASQPSAARAVQGHDFSPPWNPSNGCFFHFSPQWGLPNAQKNCPNNIFRRYLHVFPQNPPNLFFNVLACFCNGFLQNRIIYTFVAVNPFQNIMSYNVSNSLTSPNLWRYRYLPCFLQFFHVPMLLANSNINTRNPSKTLFFTVFLQCFPTKTR